MFLLYGVDLEREQKIIRGSEHKNRVHSESENGEYIDSFAEFFKRRRFFIFDF